MIIKIPSLRLRSAKHTEFAVEPLNGQIKLEEWTFNENGSTGSHQINLTEEEAKKLRDYLNEVLQ